ncbi:sensor histidine kinase [Actinomadura oligospora]|uniref:sensor histidine kinase n=1 Tax=Actinomadura oligospora TaxID=111804 RepID=UPI0009FEF847|nr:sensor histidine kinase [Actinomadura oligospora]
MDGRIGAFRDTSVRRWRDEIARVPWALDVAVCVVAAAGNAYRIGAGTVDAGERGADGWAFGLGVAMAVCLLGRRRWPASVLAVVAGLWLVYHLLDYPGGAPAVAVWVALYSVAVARRRWPGLVVAALLIVADLAGRARHTGAEVFDSVLDGSTVVFVAMLLLGDSVRSRRARRAEFEGRLAALAERREHETAQRVAEERIRVARELHDVSAHTIAVIGVQSSVAAEFLDDDPPRAREALLAVRRATSEALGELRATVRVLREEGDTEGTTPSPGLDDLERLAASYGDAGPRIVLRAEGEPHAVPRLVGLTAYRIVQEALANALRHGDPETVEVVVRYRDDGLDLEIRDDGRGAEDGTSGGHGLRGMAERAAGLGGRVEARTAPEGGFRVRAWLPGGGTT